MVGWGRGRETDGVKMIVGLVADVTSVVRLSLTE